ncbi:MAG: Heat shock protein HSP20 [Nitrosopumilales archaeon]|nr:MAG: Heat shock protein HSP20 [Nitrosopumilales archaeon]
MNMTNWLDDEFDKLFQMMSKGFPDLDDLFEKAKSGNLLTFGPYIYGYSMMVGPDGKPVVKEYGNVRPELPSQKPETREPLVDTFVDEKTKTLTIVAEMPGVEKKDIKVVVEGKKVCIDAEHGDKKYHLEAPIKEEVDDNAIKASYTNGILEVHFKLQETGKNIEVD